MSPKRASAFCILAGLTTPLAAQFPCAGNGVGNAYLSTTAAIAGGSLTMNLGSPTAPSGLALLVFGNDGGPQYFACLDTSGLFLGFPAVLDISGNATFTFPMPLTAFGLGPLFAAGLVLDSGQWSLTKTVRVAVEFANSYHELPPLGQARCMHTVDAFEAVPRDNRTGAIVIGGATGSLIAPLALGSTHRYDSLTRTWTNGPALTLPRANHRSVRLPDGRLLISGGMINAAVGTGGPATADCVIYDPNTNTFAPTGAMLQPRMGHGLSLLPDGRVFASGGFTDWTDAGPNFVARLNTSTDTTETWSPVTGQWSAGPTMASKRTGHTQTRVGNWLLLTGGIDGGTTLIAGGFQLIYVPTFTASCEIFDPAIDAFLPAPALAQARGFHAASSLSNGDVLVSGGAASIGFYGEASATNTCAVWSPVTNAWTPTAPLPTGVAFHTQIPHPTTGAAIVTGGFVGNFQSLAAVNTTSLHDGTTASILATVASHPSLPQAMLSIAQHGACLLHDDTLLVTAGFVQWFQVGIVSDRTFVYIVP